MTAPQAAPSTLFLGWRKRRGSVAHRRYGVGYIIIAHAPDVARVGCSDRAATAERRTTIDEPTRVRMRALTDAGWSLRKIAREFGVSHETVRNVLREAERVEGVRFT